jgi:hypothetical protein
MARAATKRLSTEEAERALRDVLANPPYRHDGDSTSFLWERPQWKKLSALLTGLPVGVSQKLVDDVLDVVGAISPIGHLEELPAHHDDAIVRFLEARQATDADAAFVIAALRAIRRGDRHRGLRDALFRTQSMPWASDTKRSAVRALIAKHPEYVDGAQAAIAIAFEPTSRYLPILAADASPASLDILLPHLEAARAGGDDLDWMREDLVPLFPDTPHARAWIASLDRAADDRTEASPAKAWVETLGMKAPAIVKFTLTFRAGTRVIYQVKADSTSQHWLFGRRTAKWRWSGIAPEDIAEHVGDATAYVLRAGAGLDRTKLDAWARSLIAT